MITEADTCRQHVVPKLYATGWSEDQISEQKSFTDGRNMVAGSKPRRRPQKRANSLHKIFELTGYKPLVHIFVPFTSQKVALKPAAPSSRKRKTPTWFIASHRNNPLPFSISLPA